MSRVRVTASPEPAGASIAIEDDGKGIAPTARSKVLERGARLDQRGVGAGLGLAIVLDCSTPMAGGSFLVSDFGGLKAVIAPGAKID